MNIEIKTTAAQNILKGLGIEIADEFPNLKYRQITSDILHELQSYLDLQGLVLAYEDDLEPDMRALFPYTSEFQYHIENGLGIDPLACEEERRNILAMAQGGQA